MGIQLEWHGQLYFLVNIYSTCDLRSKRKLWEELREIKDRFAGDRWCIAGDFNAVKKDGERKGTNFCANRLELFEFNDFIDSCNLIDVSVCGNKFTWFNNEGS